MKSGNRGYAFALNLNKYENAHQNENCMGKFNLIFSLNGFYDGTALGPIRVGCIPMLECSKCGVAYYLPKFIKILESIIAENLITSKGILNKKQIKFLRQYFDLTQEALGKMLDTDKYEIAKMESSKYARVMSVEKQIVMKLRFAKLLDIKSAETLYELSEPTDKEVKIVGEWFPKGEEEVKKLLKKVS
ncbi:MAG: hypothetical protein HQK53_11135 [Oligoflexia bacterium]|nr:hypothetical protein [Oligoflexia bacterium]